MTEQKGTTKWNKRDLSYLKENYATHSLSELATYFGRSEKSVQVKASRIGIAKRLHSQDDTYFDCIDSHGKAYWLGFIAADGYVIDSPEQRNYELGIELAASEHLHLAKFLNAVHSDQDICYRSRKTFKSRGNDTSYDTCFIRIYSQRIVRALERLGVVPRKSFVVTLPGLPSQYIGDYIRGYFDGNGSFCLKYVTSASGTQHEYMRAKFIGASTEFFDSLYSILTQNGIACNTLTDGQCTVLQIDESASVRRFFNFIYTNRGCVMLERKFDIAQRYYQSKRLPA